MFALQIFVLLSSYSLACLSFGTFLMYLLSRKRELPGQPTSLTVLASSFMLGFGILAQVWILIALLGWFSPMVVFGVVVLCILSGTFLLKSPILGLSEQISLIYKEFRVETWSWRIIYVLIILVCLWGATTIGRGLHWDAQVIYMAYPKLFAAVHALKILPGLVEWQRLGFQGEMHYAALMSLGSPDAARLFTWPVSLAGAVMLLAICAKAGLGRRGQWIALAMFSTSTAVTNLIGDGKTDLFAASLGLAACYWILSIDLRLTGLFTGLTLVAKATYLLNLLPVMALLFIWQQSQGFHSWRERDILSTWVNSLAKKALLIAVWCMPAVLPQLLKNAFLFRNAAGLPYTQAIGWDIAHWQIPPHLVFRFLLSFPLSVTYGNYPSGQYGNLSSLVLAFSPLAFLLPRPRNWLNSLLCVITIAALIGMLTYAVIVPQLIWPVRYYLAVLLLFIPLAARGAEYVTSTNGISRWLSAGVMICLFAILVGRLYDTTYIGRLQNGFEYLQGEISPCDVGKPWNAGLWCFSQEVLNREASLGSRSYQSITSSVYATYWLRSDLMQCSYDNSREYIPLNKPSEAWQELYQRDFIYLFLDVERDMDKMFLFYRPMWAHLVLVYEDESKKYVLYHVEYVNPPFKKLVTCRQSSPLIWDVVQVDN